MKNISRIAVRDVASNTWFTLVAIACVAAALASAGCGAASPADAVRPDDGDASAPIVDPGTPPEDSDASTPSTDPGADTEDPGGFLAACNPESNARFCSRLGKNCGTVTARDNCGNRRSVRCGTCTAPTVCSNNVCSCTRETDAQFCARLGKTCGTVTAVDNCGATRTVSSCGTCLSPSVCGSNNVCSCTRETDAQFCTRLRATCGVLTATDNCGSSRSVSCGTCASGQGCCGGNTCIALNASPNCGACGVTCDAAHSCSNSACRLVDGQRGCSVGTDCVSGVCSQFFADVDADGQGDITKPVTQCGVTPGVGLSTSSTDCCDSSAAANRRGPPPDPNQGPWFTVPVTGACVAGHKPFDYDCDGVETMQDPLPFTGCGGDIETCGPIGGIWFGTVPACGVQGAAVACLFLDDGTGCVPFEQFFKIQACR